MPLNPFREAAKRCEKGLKKVVAELKRARTTIHNLNHELSLYNFWVTGFGRSGIQSYMLDSMTPYLNERANHHASMMFGGDVAIEFHAQRKLADGRLKEDFHVVVENRFGADVYNGNSAGEQERVDICVAFALQDFVVTRQGADLGLCILDEVGKNLDQEGTEAFYRLLEQIARERSSTFVITHSPQLESMFNRVWVARKENGVSRLVCDN